MSVWNVFNEDAFNLATLTAEINKLSFTPAMISEMGLFEEQGVPNIATLVEELNETIALLTPKPRGSGGAVVNADKRRMHPVSVPHIPQRATILADEVQGVREFGSESNTKTVESVRNSRLAKMRRQIDYVIEYHRLLALQGSYMDNNGAIQSAYTLLGGSRDSVDFVLGTDSTKIKDKCLEAQEHVEAGLDGTGYGSLHALCSPGFWRKLVSHPVYEKYRLNMARAPELQTGVIQAVEFCDIIFHRYRGTSAVKVPDGKALLFPGGVPEMYITRFAPADYMETVNTTGLPYYAKSEPLPMNKGVAIEAQSNPLNICLRPTALVELDSSN